MVTLVSHTKVSGPTGGTTPPIDISGASLVVASVGCFNPSGGLVISDALDNIWVPLAQQGTIGITKLFYSTNLRVGLDTFTASGAEFITLSVAAFSEIIVGNPLDASIGAASDSSSGINTGDIAATVDNELFITAYETDRTGDNLVSDEFIITDSTTFIPNVRFASALAYKLSSGTEDPMWSNTDVNPGRESAVLATFLPDTGAGSGRATPNAPALLSNGWLAGTPVPSSCSVGVSPDFYETKTGKLYTCISGNYELVVPPIHLTGVKQLSFGGLPVFANNAAALAGGLIRGKAYRTGGDPDLLCVVH